MGASICPNYTAPLQPTQARTYPRLLRRRRRKAPSSQGRRGVACAPPYRSLPLFRRPRCVLVHHQLHHIFDRAFLCRILCRSVLVYHPTPHLPPRQPILHPTHNGRLVLRYGNLVDSTSIPQSHRFRIARTQARQSGQLVWHLGHRDRKSVV